MQNGKQGSAGVVIRRWGHATKRDVYDTLKYIIITYNAKKSENYKNKHRHLPYFLLNAYYLNFYAEPEYKPTDDNKINNYYASGLVNNLLGFGS